jgi:hypothetical protein
MEDFGSITSKEAFDDLGVAHLPRRILDLKEKGHKIKDEYESGKNRYNEPCSYKRYSLVKEEEEGRSA